MSLIYFATGISQFYRLPLQTLGICNFGKGAHIIANDMGAPSGWR